MATKGGGLCLEPAEWEEEEREPRLPLLPLLI
jgi:hypothetical protein